LSIRVTAVALFPVLILVPEVTTSNMILKFSLPSTKPSIKTRMDMHMTIPSEVPGPNVARLEVDVKSSSLIAEIADLQ
jgi:hypothetical protein